MSYFRITLIICVLLLFSCETPTQFTEEVLEEVLITEAGDETDLQTVLNTHKGQKIVIDVWGSWCRDCLESLPEVMQLQQEFPNVAFVFLSEDRTQEAWKKGIEKYQIKGTHYFIKSGTKGVLKDFLSSNWIPRYMIINEVGDIVLFKATSASDERIKTILQ